MQVDPAVGCRLPVGHAVGAGFDFLGQDQEHGRRFVVENCLRFVVDGVARGLVGFSFALLDQLVDPLVVVAGEVAATVG